MVKMQLHENWQLCNVKEQEWVPAQVPGDIYMALLQAGKMEDPFWEDNEYQAKALMEEDSAKSITDNDLAACCNCIKAIQICTVQMLQCIFSAARIQSIAVCQKGQSALLFAQICHCLCIVRTKESQISQLTKMHLDGYKLAFHINIPDSGCNTKLFQLVNLASANRASKIRKINC